MEACAPECSSGILRSYGHDFGIGVGHESWMGARVKEGDVQIVVGVFGVTRAAELDEGVTKRCVRGSLSDRLWTTMTTTTLRRRRRRRARPRIFSVPSPGRAGVCGSHSCFICANRMNRQGICVRSDDVFLCSCLERANRSASERASSDGSEAECDWRGGARRARRDGTGTHGLLLFGLRGAGTSQRTSGPYLGHAACEQRDGRAALWVG
jgi:hypothetical protein